MPRNCRALNSYYSQDHFEHDYATASMFGHYAGIFWGKIALNILLPQLLWFRSVRLNQLAMMLITFGVIIGMWLPLGYLAWSLFRSARAPDNPWGATGLEWQTRSPPPVENFTTRS